MNGPALLHQAQMCATGCLCTARMVVTDRPKLEGMFRILASAHAIRLDDSLSAVSDCDSTSPSYVQTYGAPTTDRVGRSGSTSFLAFAIWLARSAVIVTCPSTLSHSRIRSENEQNSGFLNSWLLLQTSARCRCPTSARFWQMWAWTRPLPRSLETRNLKLSCSEIAGGRFYAVGLSGIGGLVCLLQLVPVHRNHGPAPY